MRWNPFKKTTKYDNLIFNDLQSVHNVDPRVSESLNCINHKFGNYLDKLLNLNMSTGPWLAGGILQKLYHNQPPGRSDWDIWCSSVHQFYDAKAILDNHCKSPHGTKNALTYTIKFENTEYKIQLISTQYFKTAKEVIDQFDFSVCQLITDNKTMLLGEYTARDLKSKTLRLVSPPKAGIISRVTKYIVYGYIPSKELIQYLKELENDDKWQPSSDY